MRQFVAEAPHLVIAKIQHVGWRKLLGGTIAVFFGVMILVQLFYPANTLLPYTKVDGISVAGKTKQQAITMLNKAYANHTIAIYMGSGREPVTSPKLSDVDGEVDNTTRINNMDYPWYMRLVPTSLFWSGQKVATTPAPKFGDKFTLYISKKLMPNCQQQPVNATLKAGNGKLSLVPAVTGGSCAEADVITSIKAIRPTLTAKTAVKVALSEHKPDVLDSAATDLADTLNLRLKAGTTLLVNSNQVTITANDLLAWLDFTADSNKLIAKVNIDRTSDWLNKNVAAKVAVAAGISYVKTLDFTELSRIQGAPGRAIDIATTVNSLQQVVDGANTAAAVVTKTVPPSEQYTRAYSPDDAGLSALMTNYAHDHPGTFGISMVELDGQRRRASFNGDNQFVTASTYKLFVAYELLKQIDAGKRDWDSNAACFNKMISQSDNACAESFLNMLGLSTITNDIQAIGLKNSTFMKNGGPYTTANDLTLMLGMIATGQNFSSTNQQRLVAAMEGNVYRQGIPAGVQGTVADKVGFLNGLFHDAAIVYGPHGTYVLAIMTDGSSWATVADLAKQIDNLHAQ